MTGASAAGSEGGGATEGSPAEGTSSHQEPDAR